MLQKLLLCFLSLFFSLSTFSQVNLDSAISAYDDLDWSYFQTGILYNRIPFNQLPDLEYNANPLRFHPDSLEGYAVSAPVFEQLYYDLALADRYQQFFDTSFNFDEARIDWVKQGDIPIGFLDFEVDYIKPEASEAYWIAYDTITGRFFHPGDTLNFQDSIPNDTTLTNFTYVDTTLIRTDGGYKPSMLGKTHLVAVSLLDRSVGLKDITETVRYFVPASVYGSGYSVSLGVQIDFDDGTGWQSLVRDGEYNVTYSSFGVKNVRIRNVQRPTEGGIAATFNVTVYQTAPSASQVISSFSASNCVSGLDTKNAGEILMSVRYASGNQSLTNPVLVVEDFDERLLKDSGGNIQQNNKVAGYGTVGYQGIHSGRIFDEVGNEVFRYTYSKNMVDSLLANGLDVVFVDFKDSWASIETNGKAVMLAIDWINAELANEQPFGVIGLGTGGLMVNYALNRFEQGGCCHHVDKFIAFDTPLKGINIPLGLQKNAEYIHSGNSEEGKLLGAKGLASLKVLNLLKSPLFQQIAVYNIERPKVYEMAAIDPLPKDCYNIAIANSSLQGNNYSFGQGAPLFEMVTTKYVQEIWTHFCGTNFLNYRKSRPFSVHNQNQYNSSSVLEYVDAGLTDNGNYHRTYNKLIWVISVAIVLILIAALFDWLGAAIIFAIYLATCFTVENIMDNYNNTYANEVISGPTLAYDNAPGSRGTALGGLFSTERSFLFKGYAINDEFSKPIIEEFSLVSTTSALGIETDDLNAMPNSLSFGEEAGLIPFNTYYNDPEQGGTHQYHVEFTERNTQYMYEVLKQTTNTAAYSMEGELDQYYNFGKTGEVTLGDIVIKSGGELAINDKNPWGYGGQGGLSPSFDNKIEVYTKRCGAHIEVQNNGFFDLGNGTYTTGSSGNLLNQRVNLYVRKGGVLELETGSELIVRDSSLLVIEDGAELIVHPGATILLEGAGATLELVGKLTLKQGAIFTPTGTGVLRFSQIMSLATAGDYLNYEGSNTILIDNGLNVEVLTNTWFTSSLDSLAILNSSVYIAGNKYLAIHGNFYTDGTEYFKRTGDTYKYHSVQVFGQAKAKIQNCKFTGGSYGLLALLATYGNPLIITNCEFYHCGHGLETQGKRASVVNCTFEDNGVGWVGRDHDGECNFTNSLARYNGTGINFTGQIGSKLIVENAELNSNQYGLSIEGSILRSTCTDYKYNQYGIYALESDLNLHNKAQNIFNNSGDDIWLDEVHSCKLINGYNLFNFGNNYISGTLSTNATPTLVSTDAGLALPVTNNGLPAVGGSVAINVTLGGNAISLYDWVAIISYPTFCQNFTPYSVCPTCPGKTLQVSTYENLYLNEVIDVASEYIVDNETEGNPYSNLEAMNILADAMNYVHLHARYGEGDEAPGDHVFDSDELLMMDEAFTRYMMALSNAYRHGVLTPNRALTEGEVNPYLDYILQEAQYRMVHQVPYSEDPYMKGFHYSLAQPQAYRIGEHYTQALSLLGEAETWAMGDELQTAMYWDCVYRAEEELILEEIDVDHFLNRMYICIENTANKRSQALNTPVHNGGVELTDVQYAENIAAQLQINLFPNPSKGTFTITVEGDNINDPVSKYFIYSLHGMVLLEGKLKGVETQLKLPQNFSQGAYNLVIKQNGQAVAHHKLVVVK